MTELYVTTFVASLLGSLHCVGMCGGLAAISSAPSPGSPGGRSSPAVVYNLGRLVAYVILGATAGALGAALDLAGTLSGLGEVAAVVAGGIIILTGAALLFSAFSLRSSSAVTIGGTGLLERTARRWMPRLFVLPPTIRASALGLASALLPCGWLYAFVLSAAGTGSPATGMLLMTAFWLGTVPALLGVGIGAKEIARRVGPRLSWLLPVALVVVGIFTVLHRAPFEALGVEPSSAEACHGHPGS